MKSLLSITVAVFALAPVLFADDSKAAAQPKAPDCEQAKASDCCASEKKSGPKEAALRVTLLTHKGALVAKR